jgi:hypothetical protein
MLSDDDAINDVNPFVTHDFSLPGGVRQTGNFADFIEVKKVSDLGVVEKSVFCSTGLCEDQTEPRVMRKKVRPHRNIDCGFTNTNTKSEQQSVVVGVSNRRIPYFWIFLVILILTLVLLYVRR